MSENSFAASPGQTIGPFFHYALPYEGGGQLVPPAAPGSVFLHGTVFDGAGEPVPDALVEIRQADPHGHVPRREGSLHRDGHFTGWGRAATNASGRYLFTTLTPGPVHGGAAFFGITLFARGLLDRLFTRAYLPGESDAFTRSLTDAERSTLQIEADAEGGLRFDIHLQGPGETVFLTFPRHAA
ncbi:protocatechuate 3,4-dioxygenase subunit alpha [Kineosporia succinea]|uniref:Protocatechuate 3,4-dioxygenase alpha subunit n=1 Tax=Kineosporia succinea TaxID=84632 RepID=A0ABT9PEU7_9ACTN|nr:protocatechuate 3,4-dioxygenase subunit alpha [Kineosporia succinea]MDP9830924.1 protocatechuate 3,4-dioxygenase alpha subunit [Kineosporia succinea]